MELQPKLIEVRVPSAAAGAVLVLHGGADGTWTSISFGCSSIPRPRYPGPGLPDAIQARRPGRSAAMSFFEGFQLEHVDVGTATLRLRHGGSGPVVLLLHGHPRTHTTWYRVAPLLVDAGFTVVCADLPGYGESRRVAGDFSKRALAGDLAKLMERFGAFSVVGHDRGTGVAHRLAVDGHAERLVVLDGLPMVGEYRAGANVDRYDEAADRAAGRRVTCPTLVGWSLQDDLEELHGDPVAIWRAWVDGPLERVTFDSGHHVAEEAPEAVAAALAAFLQ